MRALKTASVLALPIFILAFSFFTIAAFAEEGFHTLDENLPQALVEVEKATVAVWDASSAKSRQIAGATAVLVDVYKTKHGQNRGLFITNAHVMASCQGQHVCGLKAYHRYIYNGLGAPVAMRGRESWVADLKLVSFNPDVDLAAFSIELPSRFSARPVQLRRWAHNDDARVYALGNPKLEIRSEWHVKAPVDDRRTLWSQGFVNRVLDNVIKGTMVKIVYSSADLLPGSSGGPLVDVNGTVVGINRSILRTPKYVYGGDMYANSIGVETVESFLTSIVQADL